MGCGASRSVGAPRNGKAPKNVSGPVGLGVASGINVEDNADRANCGAADASARPSLRDMLRANGLCGELVGVLKPVGDAAMEKLETHVQAARIMDIISRIVLKINEDQNARAVCEDLANLALQAAALVVKAVDVLHERTHILDSLQAGLEDAHKIIVAVTDGTWVTRVVSEQACLKDVARRVSADSRLLTADTLLERDEEVREMQRRVRATVQGGFFPSRQDMLARVCTLAGVSERAITEADVTALSRDGGKMEQLLSEIVAGKAPRGSQSGSKQSAADKTVPGASVCSSKADLVLDQVIESVPQEIRRLPVPLMRLWTDADGFDLADLTMPWDLFADSVGCMPMLEGLEDWYDTSLGSPELSEFLETFVKPRLAPDGIISVVRLHVTAKKVQHMLSVPKDKVDLKACLEFIHRLDVQKNVAPRPRRTAALSTGIADGLMSRSDSCTVSTGGHVLGRVIPLGAVGEALEELRRELQPFEFVDDTYERMAHFCPGTRAWIKGEVFAWANDPSSKPMLALLAPPGFGKTSIASHLADVFHGQGRLVAGHYCQAGHEARAEGMRIVKSLAYQIAANVPGTVFALRDALRSLGQGASVGEACLKLVIEPLRAVEGKEVPVVIVLDALDESGTAGRNSLLMLIVNEFAMLPPWVKLIVTSRPESYITRATRALERLEQIVLDRDDPYNLQDIAVYIDSSLKEADGVNLTLAGRANMAQMIQRKSEGIFGYVAALVDMVHSGGLRQIRVGALPQGQSALYSDYLDRQFGKGRLSESARALVVDRMLPAIASARVPMKVSDLKLVLSAAGAPAKVVDEAVASAGSLFPIDGDGCMRCFHRSVLDFLRGTGAEEEGNEGNPWRVDMAAAHRIQAAVWGKQVLSLGPGAVDKRPSELIGVYGTTFAITHALLAAVESKAAPSTLPRVSLSARPKVVQIGQVPTGWDLVEVLICNLNLLVAMTEIPGVGALGYLMDVVTASDAMSAAGCDVKNVMAARRTSYSFPTTAIQVGPLDVCLLCPPDSWMYKAAVKAVAAGAQPRLRAAKPMRMFPGAMVRVNGGAFGCRGHVAVSQGSAVCVWSTSTLELCAVNTRHTDSVSCLAFSPDGKLIASGSDDKTIRVWLMDAIDTFEVVLVGHTAVPRHVVFSPDNQLLASASEDSTVRIWNFKDAREIYCLREHKKWTRHLIWRPRAKEEGGGFTLLSASDDGTVHGWDPNTGDCLYCLEGHTKPINRMSMSPNGALLATASVDHTVRLWDLRNRQIVRVLEGHTGPVMSCVFCGQDRLVSGSWDTTVRIWDVASGDLVTSLQGHQGGVLSLAANATADVIASCSTDESLKLWGASNGALIANRGHDSGVPLAVLNEDGSLVCSGTITGQIMLSRTADGAVRGQLRRPPLPPSALALAPAVAASLQGNTVQVWSRQAGTRLHLLDAGTKSTLDFVTMTPEGALVVAATRDGTLRVWDVLTGKLRTALEAASATDDAASGHRQWVRSDMSSHLSVAEKQRRRSIARRTAEAREVEMTTGPMREISVPIVSAIAVDDAGVQVAVGWMTGDVEVIDVGSGSVKSLEEHAGKLTAIAFAPGGSIVATGTDEGCVRLWDVETGVLRATLSGATAQINSVTFSPDGRRVGVATGHGQVLVWDIDTGDTVFKVECPRGIGARYMCFSPDGKHVVAASAADDVAVWELESAKHVWQVKVPGLVMVRALSDVPRLSGDGDVTACTEGWLHVMLGPMQGSFGVGHLEGDFLQVGAEQATHMFTIMAGATKGATFMEMRIPARDVAG